MGEVIELFPRKAGDPMPLEPVGPDWNPELIDGPSELNACLFAELIEGVEGADESQTGT